MEAAVQRELELLGTRIVDESILEKLCNLARNRGWDAENLANQWTAHAANRDLVLSIEELEKWECSLPANEKNAKMIYDTPKREKKHIHNKDTIDAMLEDSSVFEAYSTPEIKQTDIRKRIADKRDVENQSKTSLVSKHQLVSPSISPELLTPLRLFQERGNSGEVCCKLNIGSLSIPTSWRGRQGEAVEVMYIPSIDEALKSPYKYMFQRIGDKAEAFKVVGNCLLNFV
ncbi:DNA polymerase alpha subunit B-like [Corticium candelabrum]|uniref:DNA polymerase alpha subunit B-like n=1 Tax=Corticium candelabrum TaxID=121492 RepID=UPI002E25F155|nr:DNA polymerase alpha subunit B-like [Corticium candelabrum]